MSACTTVVRACRTVSSTLGKRDRSGSRKRFRELSNSNFLVSYDRERRVPRWVYEVIGPQDIDGPLSRKKCRIKFSADTRIKAKWRSLPEDYHKGKDMGRGHMAAAGNHRRDLESRKATFLLSNIAPQNSHLNQVYWNDVECDIRKLAKEAEKVHILTGPLFLKQRKKKPAVMGADLRQRPVSIPTHFFKVVVQVNGDDVQQYGLVIPNQPVERKQPRSDFAESLERIEELAGLALGDLLPKDIPLSGSEVTPLPH